MTRVLHIPCQSMQAARRIAYAVEAGRIPCLPHYSCPAAAQAEADNLNALHCPSEHERFRPHTFILASTTTDDGRIPVARVGLGDVAAVAMIGCFIWAVGIASCWEDLV